MVALPWHDRIHTSESVTNECWRSKILVVVKDDVKLSRVGFYLVEVVVIKLNSTN